MTADGSLPAATRWDGNPGRGSANVTAFGRQDAVLLTPIISALAATVVAALLEFSWATLSFGTRPIFVDYVPTLFAVALEESPGYLLASIASHAAARRKRRLAAVAAALVICAGWLAARSVLVHNTGMVLVITPLGITRVLVTTAAIVTSSLTLVALREMHPPDAA